MKYRIIALVVLVASCTNLTVSQRAYIACSGYVSALKSLTTFKRTGQLSASMIRRVDEAREIVNPLCQISITSHSDLDRLEEALGTILNVRNEANG